MTNAGAESLTKKSIGFSNSVSTGDEMVEIKKQFSPGFVIDLTQSFLLKLFLRR